jgi:MiaB-like tRNA modifying enzyme
MLEIYFETFGCTANYNSTEIMKGLVKQAGLNITSNSDFADLIILNSCIVKEPTEEKIRRKIQDLLNQNKKIILAGCMAGVKNKLPRDENLFLLGTKNIRKIVELIKDIQENFYDEKKYTQKKNEVKINLPKIPKEKNIGITQISEGCLGECSYCIVRLAKGKLFSYPQEKIIQSIKNDIESGCKEIWITSQDNASYRNEDGEYAFPELLKKILEIKGNFFVRVGMMNPNNVLKILPELLEIYEHKKMFKFIHIPIQSGSDRILKKMKREYSKKDVMKIIQEFKKKFPDVIISTDIIVGFPEETEKEFEETMNLIEKIKPEILNISKFWPRQNTPAEKLPQIHPDIRSKRASKLSKLHMQICLDNQKKWLGWKGKVLVDQIGFGNTYLARSQEYKLFAVQSKEKILGKIVKVKVTKTLPHYLISELSD